jgi:hypothetical protein
MTLFSLFENNNIFIYLFQGTMTLVDVTESHMKLQIKYLNNDNAILMSCNQGLVGLETF